MSALSYLIETIKQKQDSGVLSDEIFFRGQRDSHALVPFLLRNVGKFKKDLPKTENNFFCDALVMGAAEMANAKNSWEQLALLQHYEIPTRLLDWSSSLTSALFFALLKCLKCDRIHNCQRLRKSCEGNPVIWVLDPYKMHQAFYGGDPAAVVQLAVTIGVDAVPDYKTEFVVKEAPANDWPYTAGPPIFMEIPWVSARMRSQKGYFTFHYSQEALENLVGERNGLVKIVIP